MRELWDDAPWWAVGYDLWGKIDTFDPADTQQEAIEFIKEFLSDCPKAKAMTREQLENALAEEEDAFWKERVRIWEEINEGV